MNLYTNGCSFTQGHKEYVNHVLPPEWVWPNHLKKLIDGEVVNEAWNGGSNQRIFRRTVEFFKDIDPSEKWTAVIQWSSYSTRYEFFDDVTGTHVGIIKDDFLLDDRSADIFNEFPQSIVRKSKISTTFLNLVKTPDDLATETILMIHGLTEFLQKRNVNVLHIFMTRESKKFILENNNILNELLPTKNIADKSMMDLIINDVRLMENFPDDKHPNKFGHVVIADYIIDELTKRKYL